MTPGSNSVFLSQACPYSGKDSKWWGIHPPLGTCSSGCTHKPGFALRDSPEQETRGTKSHLTPPCSMMVFLTAAVMSPAKYKDSGTKRGETSTCWYFVLALIISDNATRNPADRRDHNSQEHSDTHTLPAAQVEGLRSDISYSLFCCGRRGRLRRNKWGSYFFRMIYQALGFLQWRAVSGCFDHDSWGWVAISTAMVLSLQMGRSGSHSVFFILPAPEMRPHRSVGIVVQI